MWEENPREIFSVVNLKVPPSVIWTGVLEVEDEAESSAPTWPLCFKTTPKINDHKNYLGEKHWDNCW